MIDDDYFLELPVYTVSESVFDSGFDELLEREAQAGYSRSGGTWPGKDLTWFRERVERDRHIYLRGFGGPWQYNQICGFLCIFPLGHQLRGDAWLPEKRIQRRTRRKRTIVWRGKAFEMSVEPEDSSPTILENLLREIRDLCNETPFKGRYVDTGTLLLQGPFVNWREIVDRSTARGPMGLRVSDLWTSSGKAAHNPSDRSRR